MKRRLTIAMCALLLALGSNAQTLQSGEYFFNTDPGTGKGTPISISPSDTVRLQGLAVAATGLQPGFHVLMMRFKNSAGIWSLVEMRPFLLEQLNPIASTVVAAEFFIDNDPGVGKATALPIATGSVVSQQVSIPLPSLAPGFHNLIIRVRNNLGRWSLFEPRSFYIVPFGDVQRQLVAGEYFIDVDPGVGNAASINIQAPVSTFQSTLQLPVPQGLPNGQHFLLARVKDNLGRWSLLAIDTFTVDNTLPVTGLWLSGVPTVAGNQLTWVTLTESGTKNFAIEHSIDGINFKPVGDVAAAGNSTERLSYAFLHRTEVKRLNYYRLKQVDKDGRYAHSNIILVEYGGYSNIVAVFPNPAKDMLNIKSPLGIATNSNVVASIYNQNGQLVSTQKLQANTVDVSSLPEGTYILYLSDGTERLSTKFIKQ